MYGNAIDFVALFLFPKIELPEANENEIEIEANPKQVNHALFYFTWSQNLMKSRWLLLLPLLLLFLV